MNTHVQIGRSFHPWEPPLHVAGNSERLPSASSASPENMQGIPLHLKRSVVVTRVSFVILLGGIIGIFAGVGFRLLRNAEETRARF